LVIEAPLAVHSLVVRERRGGKPRVGTEGRESGPLPLVVDRRQDVRIGLVEVARRLGSAGHCRESQEDGERQHDESMHEDLPWGASWGGGEDVREEDGGCPAGGFCG